MHRPSREGFFYLGEKLEKGGFHGADGLAKNFLSTFLEIFGKFVNKNLSKVVYVVV